MKIVICAVPFSPNLGDGAIFESIRSRYEAAIPSAEITPLDIAGRTQHQASKSNLDRLQKFPRITRRYIVVIYCIYKYITNWRSAWREKLIDADIITIGGGQLFLDEELNFPIKLYLLSRQIKARKCRKNISFVGVSSKISHIGNLLFKIALSNINPDSISVRDLESKGNFLRLIGSNKNISVVPDPALYFEKNRQPPQSLSASKNKIAICISSPQSLDAEKKLGDIFHQHLTELYIQLIKKLAQRGMKISIFSNGAPEDEQLKSEIYNKIPEFIANQHPSPITPRDLICHISQADLIIAHRLHANIISYSLGIPSIGLNWDPKVKSFFLAVQRENFYMDEILPSVDKIIDASEKAIAHQHSYSHERINKSIDNEIAKHISSLPTCNSESQQKYV